MLLRPGACASIPAGAQTKITHTLKCANALLVFASTSYALQLINIKYAATRDACSIFNWLATEWTWKAHQPGLEGFFVAAATLSAIRSCRPFQSHCINALTLALTVCMRMCVRVSVSFAIYAHFDSISFTWLVNYQVMYGIHSKCQQYIF